MPAQRCMKSSVLICVCRQPAARIKLAFRQRRGNLGGRVGSCPPNYNIGWVANVFCPPKKFPQHISSRPNKQTKRYRPTVQYSTNRKLRSTSTCQIESTHPPVESAHPMKRSFPCYCRSTYPTVCYTKIGAPPLGTVSVTQKISPRHIDHHNMLLQHIG